MIDLEIKHLLLLQEEFTILINYSIIDNAVKNELHVSCMYPALTLHSEEPMSEFKGTDGLRNLREMHEITQGEAARFFGFKGKSARNTISKWENGDETPRLKHRETFIHYILQKLALRDDLERFDTLWSSLCEEWRWPPLSTAEREHYLEHNETLTTRRNAYDLSTKTIEMERAFASWSLFNTIINEGTIVLRGMHGAAACRPLEQFLNLSLECEVTFVECGDDPWVGVAIRGFETNEGKHKRYHIDQAYLTYLRANGSLEFYCRSNIDLAPQKPTANPLNEWTHLKIEAMGPKISIFANHHLCISKVDTTYGAEGYVYLQSHQATAHVRNLKIYELLSTEQTVISR